MLGLDRKFNGLKVLAACACLCGCADVPVRGRSLQGTPGRPAPPPPLPALNISAPPQDTALPVKPSDPAGPDVQAASPETVQENATPGAAASDPQARLSELYRLAAAQVSAMDSYTMRLRRREVVGGRKRPEEIILVKFRNQPFSVYLKWLGPEAKGREVIFVRGRYDNLIHTKVAAGDILLMPAGKRFSLAPDSFLAKSNSRHPITNAGLAHLVQQLGELVMASAKGDSRFGSAKYLGTVKRPEFEAPVEAVQQTLVPGNDPLMPGGGRRMWYLDTQAHLPVLLISYDENQQEVEYYCHDRILCPAALDDDDFNPDKLWGTQKRLGCRTDPQRFELRSPGVTLAEM